MNNPLAASYLLRLKELGVTPNFYCSGEYFEKAGWDVLLKGDALWVEDETGAAMLPAVSFVSPELIHEPGCVGFTSHPVSGGTFWDFEFIYRPADFHTFPQLSSGYRKLLKKNMRRAEEEAGESFFLSRDVSEGDVDGLMAFVFGEDSETMYDPETIVKYLYQGENRLTLRGITSRKVYGVLAFDFNFAHINFRYCFVVPGVPGLSEYARALFYRHTDTHYPGRLVNDGGTLGKDSLLFFKKRLGPLHIRELYCANAL